MWEIIDIYIRGTKNWEYASNKYSNKMESVLFDDDDFDANIEDRLLF